MTSLQKQGMKDMILDLQGNGGGYLNAAIDLANEFLGQKELIVYTEAGLPNVVISMPKVTETSVMAASSYWWTSIQLPPAKLSAVRYRIGTEELL